MINKASKGRVKNATKVSKYGIDFKSNLECYTYEALTNAGIPVKYEPKHFELVPKFEFSGTRIWNGVWTVNKKGKRTHSNTVGEFKYSPAVNALTKLLKIPLRYAIVLRVISIFKQLKILF